MTKKRNENASLQRQWIRAQTRLVELADELSEAQDTLRGVGSRCTLLRQKQTRINSSVESEKKELKGLTRDIGILHRSMAKLNNMSAEYGQKKLELSSSNHTVELEFAERLQELQKEAEDGVEKIRVLVQEKEALIERVIELEEQILIWERKIDLERETQQALDPEIGQSEVRELKKEVHRMRLKLEAIDRRKTKMIADMEAAIYKRDDIQIRNANTKRKSTTRAALKKQISSLKRSLRDTLKQSKTVEQDISSQENDNRILMDMLERVQTEYNEAETSVLQLNERIQLANLQKKIRTEQLCMIQTRRKRMESVLAHEFHVSSSEEKVNLDHHRQNERTEALKEALRELRSQHKNEEQSFDIMLDFLTVS